MLIRSRAGRRARPSGSRRRVVAGCARLPETACGCRTAAAASHTAAGCGARARRRRRRGCRAAGPAAGRSPGGGDPGVGILAARYSFDYYIIMETEQAIVALQYSEERRVGPDGARTRCFWWIPTQLNKKN